MRKRILKRMTLMFLANEEIFFVFLEKGKNGNKIFASILDKKKFLRKYGEKKECEKLNDQLSKIKRVKQRKREKYYFDIFELVN
jgi:hypothetical protein